MDEREAMSDRPPKNNSARTARILFATAECYPFVKVGGLADVSQALPKELVRLGHQVRVVLPAYRGLPGRHVLSFDVGLGRIDETVHVSRLADRDGVELYTVGCQGWFEQEVRYSYQDGDVLPFVLFSKAVVALAALPDWRPDIIHGNDWHCGLIAQELRQGAHAGELADCAMVFTIHNIAYQGQVGQAVDATIGLPPHGNLLARGIVFADRVSTVSPQYLSEICTPEHGAGLDALLRSRGTKATGIRNGIDYTEFGPDSDPWISERYDAQSFILGKETNKSALQCTSGLEANPRRPLLGMVARLVPQKGVGLVRGALDDILARGAQVVLVGEGERRFRRELAAAARRTPGSVAYHNSSDESVARSVYAGADFFLAPSRFEPCGLTPLIALRYGTVPIVRQTGGMIDTIPDWSTDPDRGLGFAFPQRRVAALLEAVDRGLAVYRRPGDWRELQRRGMATDFSWRTPAQEYVELYRAAVRDRIPARRAVALPETPHHDIPLPVALVHHANQYLVTDGYRDREGITTLVHGYSAMLALHRQYRVPVALHLSGTLVEAVAWHHPWFLDLVRELHACGLVELVGGTYAENVLTSFDPTFNRRQLEEAFRLYERHLGCTPEQLLGCWVPERVWNTDELSEILASSELPNGGYRYVLLDDRLRYRTDAAYHGSERELFDLTDPASPPPTDALRPCRIRHGRGLEMVPVSGRMRYWVPPRDSRDWHCLHRLTHVTLAPGDDAVLVYADDLEKAAGLGPWRGDALDRYEEFLRWLVAQRRLMPVSLGTWFAQRTRRAPKRRLDPGTFAELARGWGAGEDYTGWAADREWLRCRSQLNTARRAVEAVERETAAPALLDLAWKHLLASSYETGWRDTAAPGTPLAPWARALASHARSSSAIVAAARWFGTSRPSATSVELTDVDGDGEREAVLANDRLMAVVAPRHGGRIVQLAAGSPSGGSLVIGNPTDDWNWQESLNRYMDEPPNHPGALADAGFVHDAYEVTTSETEAGAVVELVNVEPGSPLQGARKLLLLESDHAALVVRYELPDQVLRLDVDLCLSPDYLSLLREGRAALHRAGGRWWRGVRHGPVLTWVGKDSSERTSWPERPADGSREVGHGVVVRLRSDQPVFHLALGVGELDDEACRHLLERGRAALDGATTTREPVSR